MTVRYYSGTLLGTHWVYWIVEIHNHPWATFIQALHTVLQALHTVLQARNTGNTDLQALHIVLQVLHTIRQAHQTKVPGLQSEKPGQQPYFSKIQLGWLLWTMSMNSPQQFYASVLCMYCASNPWILMLNLNIQTTNLSPRIRWIWISHA